MPDSQTMLPRITAVSLKDQNRSILMILSKVTHFSMTMQVKICNSIGYICCLPSGGMEALADRAEKAISVREPNKP